MKIKIATIAKIHMQIILTSILFLSGCNYKQNVPKNPSYGVHYEYENFSGFQFKSDECFIIGTKRFRKIIINKNSKTNIKDYQKILDAINSNRKKDL